MSFDCNVSKSDIRLCVSLSNVRLFGDQIEIDFWSVATYYLCREQARMKDPTYKVLSTITRCYYCPGDMTNILFVIS